MKMKARCHARGSGPRALIAAAVFLIPPLLATRQLILHSSFQQASSWQVTDFMVNYQGGFVRRGLLGSLLLWINQNWTSIGPDKISLGQTIASLWAINAMAINTLLGKPFASSLLILYSPAFISVFYWLDPQAGGRKDTLGLALLAGCIFLYERTEGSKRVGLLSAITLVILPAMILSHEAIIFFCMPPILLLLWLALNEANSKRPKNMMQHFIWTFTPAFIAIGLTLSATKPAYEAVVKSCEAWTSTMRDLRCQPLPAYFEAIYNDSRFRQIAQMAFSTTIFYVSLAVTLAYMILAFRGPYVEICHRSLLEECSIIGSNTSDKRAQASRTLLALSIVTFAPSLPVYLLACDFGRWFAMSWTALTLFLTSPKAVSALLGATQSWMPMLGRIDRKIPQIKPRVATLFFAMTTPVLFLGHYDMPPRLLMPSNRLAEALLATFLRAIP